MSRARPIRSPVLLCLGTLAVLGACSSDNVRDVDRTEYNSGSRRDQVRGRLTGADDGIVLLGTALIAVATGVVTVVVGNLPFLGLIVPNIVSMIRGDDLRSNLPWVCLTGIAIVTVCDLIGRTIIMPFEVPVSLILGIVGSVVFVLLLLRQRRNG